MNKVEIMDIDGRKIIVGGIYYISNNNYYFIYTKEEKDDEGHIILYILKILQEVINTQNGPMPTGYLIGIKVTDENEYDLIKKDVINIVNDKQNGQGQSVRYLDLSYLKNLKVKDYRVFKLNTDIYNESLKKDNNKVVNQNDMVMDYQEKYEQQLKENENLNQTINNLKHKIDSIKEILNEN